MGHAAYFVDGPFRHLVSFHVSRVRHARECGRCRHDRLHVWLRRHFRLPVRGCAVRSVRPAGDDRHRQPRFRRDAGVAGVYRQSMDYGDCAADLRRDFLHANARGRGLRFRRGAVPQAKARVFAANMGCEFRLRYRPDHRQPACQNLLFADVLCGSGCVGIRYVADDGILQRGWAGRARCRTVCETLRGTFRGTTCGTFWHCANGSIAAIEILHLAQLSSCLHRQSADVDGGADVPVHAGVLPDCQRLADFHDADRSRHGRIFQPADH